MPITALPTPPSRNDPINFAERGDTFLVALPTFVTEANALEANVNEKEVSVTQAAQTATDKAAAAATSETNAASSAGAAATSAANASSSATAASTSATNAATSASQASASAASIDSTNIVHKTGDESVAGNKTFSGITTLTDYRENLVTANTGAAYEINCAVANNFHLTLTANCTFTIANPPPVNVAFGLTLRVKQDATGSRTITWPASVKWSNGNAPTLTTAAGKADYISLLTMDGGATWDGFVGGKNY